MVNKFHLYFYDIENQLEHYKLVQELNMNKINKI